MTLFLKNCQVRFDGWINIDDGIDGKK